MCGVSRPTLKKALKVLRLVEENPSRIVKVAVHAKDGLKIEEVEASKIVEMADEGKITIHGAAQAISLKQGVLTHVKDTIADDVADTIVKLSVLLSSEAFSKHDQSLRNNIASQLEGMAQRLREYGTQSALQ